MNAITTVQSEALLRASTSAAAKAERLTFRLATEEYEVHILRVQEIPGHEPSTRIANAPSFLIAANQRSEQERMLLLVLVDIDKAVLDDLAKADRAISSEKGKVLFAKITEARATYQPAQTKFVELAAAGRVEAAQALLPGELRPRQFAYMAAAGSLKGQAQGLVQSVAFFKLDERAAKAGAASPSMEAAVPHWAARPAERRGPNRATKVARPRFRTETAALAQPGAVAPARPVEPAASAKTGTDDRESF